ncbi:bis(5'-nucleosyl)-tetraphosphatase (symmetrical) YqeK [Synechococcus sp. PCC 7336]|uniref:bis(5'-nucleosyl)-tetraphosphatase (symmetrical) YqeK n=1 Tax=Synechococcus sp. PCC 7336 TaxID=195250 RepID=UPI00034DEA1A|nr:bis(5'-nucleosyl)-tetraphosphatase (symmetrical) YqeK [Synechococcus sp. PCC 7336]
MYSDDLRSRVMDWLEANVPRPRLRHIAGVEATARDWSRLYGLDEERAGWAGLLHDLAKYFPDDRLLDIARAEGLDIDSAYETLPHLLHAEVGAIEARDRFGVDDPAILDAIRHHTCGSPGMSPLSCVVFLADSLEPNRGQSECLQAMRRLAETHLYRAVVAVCDESIAFLRSRQQPIHPRTVQARNWFLHHLAESPLPIIQETVA